MSRKEDRVFKAKDVWRIYCNHLSITEQLRFSSEFKSVDGSCTKDFDPCDEVGEDIVGADREIKAYEKVIEEQSILFNGISESLRSGFGDLIDFSDILRNELHDYRESGNEGARSRWDNLLTKSVPDSIERNKIINGIQELQDSIFIGAFAKTGRFAEKILRQKGSREGEGLIINKIDESRNISSKLALSVLAFVTTIYKTFVEDCVK